MTGERLSALCEILITVQEGLLDQAKTRNELLYKHTSDLVAVEKKRTLAIERLSKAIESIVETIGGTK